MAKIEFVSAEKTVNITAATQCKDANKPGVADSTPSWEVCVLVSFHVICYNEGSWHKTVSATRRSYVINEKGVKVKCQQICFCLLHRSTSIDTLITLCTVSPKYRFRFLARAEIFLFSLQASSVARPGSYTANNGRFIACVYREVEHPYPSSRTPQLTGCCNIFWFTISLSGVVLN